MDVSMRAIVQTTMISTTRELAHFNRIHFEPLAAYKEGERLRYRNGIEFRSRQVSRDSLTQCHDFGSEASIPDAVCWQTLIGLSPRLQHGWTPLRFFGWKETAYDRDYIQVLVQCMHPSRLYRMYCHENSSPPLVH